MRKDFIRKDWLGKVCIGKDWKIGLERIGL